MMESPQGLRGGYFIRPILQGRGWGSEREAVRFEVTHLVSDPGAGLKAGLCFLGHPPPHSACGARGGGVGVLQQAPGPSPEPSHSPNLLRKLFSHSHGGPRCPGCPARPLGEGRPPPLLPAFLTGHSLGPLSKEEAPHPLILSKPSTYPRVSLCGLLWLKSPWGTQPRLAGNSFLGKILTHTEPGLLSCKVSGGVCRVAFLWDPQKEILRSSWWPYICCPDIMAGQ